MQAVWEKILDEDFIHAYLYGIVIECIDVVPRPEARGREEERAARSK